MIGNKLRKRLVLGALVCAAGLAASAAHSEDATAGKPDFSGVWTVYFPPGAPGGFAGFGAAPALPLTEEGKRRQAEYRTLSGADGDPLGGDNPGAFCVTYGMPTMMEQAGFYPIEFIQRPEQLTMIYEVEGETRRVYLDGKGIAPEDRLPSRQGYSEGHWEGNVLVVRTTDMSDGFDQISHPHSEEAVIDERFELKPDANGTPVISYSMTMTDPIYYTAPVSVTKQWMPLKDGHIMAYPCTEEPWLRLLDARREQLKAGKPITAEMKDVIQVYED